MCIGTVGSAHAVVTMPVCVFQDQEVERKESALKRLRSVVPSASREITPLPQAPQLKELTEERSSPLSHTISPALSREGTMFTPSADKELEAILNREDAPSMPSRESSMKSRPVTTETETSGTYTSPECTSRNSKPSLPEEYIEEVDRQLASATAAQESFNLPLALTPARSHLGLTPSASVLDMKGSQLSLTQLSGRRTVISRETVREREKLNEHINSTYIGLSARYMEMEEDLTKIDQGLNVAPPGSSKFLTVPGDALPLPPATSPPEQSLQIADFSTSGSSLKSESTLEESSSLGDTTSNAVARGEEGEGEGGDGQVAVSLEVPVSERTSVQPVSESQSTGNAKLVEDSDRAETQSTHYSTEYPSLQAEDVAQLLDVGDVPPSTYGGSTTYYTGVASDYVQSDGSVADSNETTLD